MCILLQDVLRAVIRSREVKTCPKYIFEENSSSTFQKYVVLYVLDLCERIYSMSKVSKYPGVKCTLTMKKVASLLHIVNYVELGLPFIEKTLQ